MQSRIFYLSPTLPVILVAFWLAACSPPMNPEFRDIRDVKIDKLGISSSTLSLQVVMFNPNNFGLRMSESDLDIYLNDQFLGRTRTSTEVSVPKKSEFVIPVKAEVDMKNLLRNSAGLLLNKEVEIRARGKMKLHKSGLKKTFDVDYSGRHKIPKSIFF